MDNKTILDKIGKLLRLSRGTNFTGEAASALAKAQALMSEHKISMAMLDTGDTESAELQDEPLEQGKRFSGWKIRLASTLAKANGVYIYLEGNATIKTVGKPANVATLKYLFDYCVLEINQLTRKSTKGAGKAYANSFRIGCIDAIEDAIFEEHRALQARMRAKAAANNNSRAVAIIDGSLVKIKQELDEAQQKARQKLNLQSDSRRIRSGDSHARQHGQQAGSRIYPGQASGRLSAPQRKLN